MQKVVTIDGPAGSGKSSVARAVAAELGWSFLDTGAMYRAATLAVLEAGVDVEDEEALAAVIGGCRIEVGRPGQEEGVWLDGRDVTQAIRSQEVTDNAYVIAGRGRLRELLVEQQRRIAAGRDGLVTEGRDQGSVVFPEAVWKFYLDASPEERARRRWEQMGGESRGLTVEAVLAAQEQRDARDRGRADGPLRVPEGAEAIDTTGMTQEEVVKALVKRIRGEA